jgi:hypothetical protein
VPRQQCPIPEQHNQYGPGNEAADVRPECHAADGRNFTRQNE